MARLVWHPVYPGQPYRRQPRCRMHSKAAEQSFPGRFRSTMFMAASSRLRRGFAGHYRTDGARPHVGCPAPRTWRPVGAFSVAAATRLARALKTHGRRPRGSFPTVWCVGLTFLPGRLVPASTCRRRRAPVGRLGPASDRALRSRPCPRGRLAPGPRTARRTSGSARLERMPLSVDDLSWSGRRVVYCRACAGLLTRTARILSHTAPTGYSAGSSLSG
jgi:hypothetical protein